MTRSSGSSSITPLLLLHLFLLGMWLTLTDEVSFQNVVIGLAVGAVVTSIVGGAFAHGGYLQRGRGLLRFLGYFVRILIQANLQVMWEIITPGFTMTPRIIRYDIAGLTPVQITVLASMITLTPGTLTADVDEDGRYLFIHCMYAGDRDAAVRQIDELRGRLLREVFGA